jgi:hypothetical protein
MLQTWQMLKKKERGGEVECYLWVVSKDPDEEPLRSLASPTKNWRETHRLQSSSRDLLKVKAEKYTT